MTLDSAGSVYGRLWLPALLCLLALLLAADAAAGGPPTAAPADKLPSYYQDQDRMALFTSRTWKVEGGGPAKELYPHINNESKDRAWYIWSPVCRPGRQAVTFVRTIEFVSTPSALNGWFSQASSTPS